MGMEGKSTLESDVTMVGIYLEGLKTEGPIEGCLRDCWICDSSNVELIKQIYPVSKRPPWYFVQCEDCGKFGEYERTPEEAVEKWEGEICKKH